MGAGVEDGAGGRGGVGIEGGGIEGGDGDRMWGWG